MKGYRQVRNVYHGLTTERLRDLLDFYLPTPLKQLKKRAIAVFEKDAVHDDIYDLRYYAKFVEPTMQLSAEVMAKTISTALVPTSVIDLGCGTGLLLQELRKNGVKVSGLELADAAIEVCRERGIDVAQFDIENDPIPTLAADLVVSTEVAEHLPIDSADRFVEALCSFGDRIVLTAATPGQGGTDHVNEQPNEYWVEKFARKGYRYESEQSLRWREDWKVRGVAGCFWSSLMIFTKDDQLE